MKTYLKFWAKVVVALSMLVTFGCQPNIELDQNGGNSTDSSDKDSVKEALVDSLKIVLSRQVKAMQDILTSEEPVQVSAYRQLQKDTKEGLYEVTLSSEHVFHAYVGQGDDFAEPLTCALVDGVNYWAYVDAEGVVVPFADEQGNKYALTSEFGFDIKDDKYFVKIADKTYELGYTIEDAIQVFECELLKDSADEFYGVRFYFGNGVVKTVYYAEYESVYFCLPGDETLTEVSELYVADGASNTLELVGFEGHDYKFVAPQGWKAEQAAQGNIVTVTAPESYEADAENPIELSVVSADGSFVFASVALTDKPFRSLEVSATGPVIAPTTGLGKFAYGIALVDEFVAADVLALGKALIAGTQTPAQGSAVSTSAVAKTFEEVLGAALDEEARYVLWVVVDSEVVSKEFGQIAVKISSPKSYLLDADLKVEVRGADAVFMGVTENVEEAKAEILDLIQTAALESLKVTDQLFSYEGKATNFTSTQGYENGMRYDTEYLVWVVPAVSGNYTYTEDDVFSYVVKTSPITPGGDLKITCGDAVVTPSTINFPIACPGAAMISYAYFDELGGMIVAASSNDDKYKAIFDAQNSSRKGEEKSVFADHTDAYASNLNDEAATTYWLAAVAVDAEGKYGEVYCASATTLKLAYDSSIKLTIEAPEETLTANSVTFKVKSTGDLSDYIYWVGRISDPFWANTRYCGGTRNGAQKYMALNPDDENIQKCMRKYGPLAADGSITITDMTMETDYAFVILEKGETYYSTVGYKKVTTLAADLGKIVREGTDKWNADKARIVIDWEEERFEQGSTGLMAYYSFNISCPTDLTAFIMCASYDYFEDMGLTRTEHIMIELEKWTSRKLDKDHTVDDAYGSMKTEPDYYKEGELKPGQLMSVNDFYVHGSPHEGAVTYFASGSHGDKNCTSWENGNCASYVRAQGKIEYYKTLEPWQNRAAAFGLKGEEAATWASALQNAYKEYYDKSVPLIYINEGAPLRVSTPYATGVNEEGIIPDRVIVMLKDLQGNYYEPMYFEVPNYFQK